MLTADVKRKGTYMIYFDNAATSFPKPECVLEAVCRSFTEFGGNPGRSSHKLSMDSALAIYSARMSAADFFGAKPENVVFTYNATYALNTAIKASYIYGTHILISDSEHNSVLRPVVAITGDSFATYNHFDSAPDLTGEQREHAIIASIRAKMKPLTKTLVCTARTNVSGIPMPVRAIGRFCRENGLYFIVDGAQSAGYDRINVEDDYIDALCVPGHKGLYGPMGTGMIIFSEHGSDCGRLSSFIEGGNGYNSLDIRMPEELPEKLEGGTIGVNVICGVKAGIEHVKSIGIDRIKDSECALIQRAYRRLLFNRKVSIYGYNSSSPLLLFNVTGKDPEETAAELNKKGICVRSGYQCAPLAHRRIGTPPGGAVRLSVGIRNTDAEIDEFLECIDNITKA